MNRRWVGGVALAVSLLVGLSLGLRARSAAKAEKAAPTQGTQTVDAPLLLSALDVVQAGPATIERALPLTGSVEAGRSAVLRSRHAGVLVGMDKRPGDRVRQGELVARLDSEDLRLRLSEREAALRQAQAAFSVAESVRQQQRRLAEQGFISKTALEQSENSYVAARSALETAQSQLAMARTALAETSLAAPIGGVIAKRMVEPGERVGPESPIVQIVDLRSLEVSVPIPAERAATLRPGQNAEFRADSTAGEVYPARLGRIVPSAIPGARTVEARFTLPEEVNVPLGAFLSGRLILESVEVPVAVPRAALRTDAGGHYLWIVRAGRLERFRFGSQPVDSGAAQIAIATGLTAGSHVLVLRGTEPREGQPVQWPGQSPAAATPPAAAKP